MDFTTKQFYLIVITFLLVGISLGLSFAQIYFENNYKYRVEAYANTWEIQKLQDNIINYNPHILKDIQRIANNVSNHTYVLGKYDCTDFSKELVRELKQINISAYCVAGRMKTSDYKLHTWVELVLNNQTIEIEAVHGYILTDVDKSFGDYEVIKKGVMLVMKIHEEIQLISFHDYVKRRLLIFKKTCSASPCQYDIYDNWELDKPKYYGRLRWGYFYVAKEPCSKPIYEFKFKDKMKGAFYNTSLELEQLKKACKKIWKLK